MEKDHFIGHDNEYSDKSVEVVRGAPAGHDGELYTAMK